MENHKSAAGGRRIIGGRVVPSRSSSQPCPCTSGYRPTYSKARLAFLAAREAAGERGTVLSASTTAVWSSWEAFLHNVHNAGWNCKTADVTNWNDKSIRIGNSINQAEITP